MKLSGSITPKGQAENPPPRLLSLLYKVKALGKGRPKAATEPSTPQAQQPDPRHKRAPKSKAGEGAAPLRGGGRRCPLAAGSAAFPPAWSSGPAGRVSTVAAAGPGSARARAAREDDDGEEKEVAAAAVAAAAGEDGGAGRGGAGGAGGRVRPAGVRARRAAHALRSHRPNAPPGARRGNCGREREGGRGGGAWGRRAAPARWPIVRGRRWRACCSVPSAGRAAPAREGLPPLPSRAGPALANLRAGSPGGDGGVGGGGAGGPGAAAASGVPR